MAEPRIVLFDLEVLADVDEAMKVFFQLGNYPGLTLKAQINSVICFGYKILGEKEVKCISAWDFKRPWAKDVNDDFAIVKAAYEILKDADAVITHNGRRFDWKFLQTRLMINDLPPLRKIPHIDTCALAKQHLYLFNNKLNTLGKLVDDKKLENGGQELWTNVRARKKSSLALMTKYCKQDVNLLEKVFRKLRPFITNLPNHNMFSKGQHVCPGCGSKYIKKHGTGVTGMTVYQRYYCNDCGLNSRGSIKDSAPKPV